MEYEVGDIVKLKKKHPCGSFEWEILRVGADFRLKCTGCGHQIMIARKLVEKNTRDLRTVPSGGARHGFELYFVCQNVEGLDPGTYHYLPLKHCIEFLNPIDKVSDVLASSLCDQLWALKANVILYFSYIPYRTEWRIVYRVILIRLLTLGFAIKVRPVGRK